MKKIDYALEDGKYCFDYDDLIELLTNVCKEQSSIIQRGFWLEPNSFDENGKVRNPKDGEYDELDQQDDDSISYSSAGNYVSTYSGTLPDFNKFLKRD